jgi:hypothetical protein
MLSQVTLCLSAQKIDGPGGVFGLFGVCAAKNASIKLAKEFCDASSISLRTPGTGDLPVADE